LVEGVGLAVAGLAVPLAVAGLAVACGFDAFVAWSVELTHDHVSRHSTATIAAHRYHRLSIGVSSSQFRSCG
jgi:hypothetical protein